MTETPRIQVEKTLHAENTSVQQVAYSSLTRPSMLEVSKVLDDSDSGSTRTIVRGSDDNGRTWTMLKEWSQTADDPRLIRSSPHYYLDTDNAALIEFHVSHFKETRAGGALAFGPDDDGWDVVERSKRLYYRISRNGGATWGPERQLVQKGGEYDETHWADGISFGTNGADFQPLRILKLHDGTLLMPVWITALDESGKLLRRAERFGQLTWPSFACACFLGRWREDLSDIDWDLSNKLSVPEYMSYELDEPAVGPAADGALMMLMRGGATPRQALPGVKFFSISREGGRTWDPAVPLTYPDGNYVNSPGCMSDLFRSPRNGKLYAITNIIDHPVRQSDPRFPLQIAEVDPKYLWVLPDTVTVIDDRRPEHHERIRFSNWARVEDRETGDTLLYMTEARIDALFDGLYRDGEVSKHAYQYRISVPD
jgi:hypothetical protein